MAFKEYFVYTFDDTSIAASSAEETIGANESTTVRFDSDADFELMKRTHIATDDRLMVSYSDDAYGRQLQNAQLDLRAISGTILFASGVVDIGIHPNNFLPYILTRPYLIRAATTFTATFADFSGSTNSVRQAFHGAKLRVGRAPWAADWKATPYFDYITATQEVAADATNTTVININIDSHFLIRRLTATRDGAALITVKDGADDRQWMSSAVHIDNLFGNAQFPNILPAPRFIWRGSSIIISIQDLSGLANTVRLVFSGEKLY